MRGVVLSILFVAAALAGCTTPTENDQLREVAPPVSNPYLATTPPVVTTTTTSATTAPTMAPAPSKTTSSPTGLNCNPPVDDGTSTTEDPALTTTHRDYEWDYGGYTWTWSADIYDDAYDYYHTRERAAHQSTWSDYAIYATDPYSQPLVDQLACLFRETMQEEGMQAGEDVRMALAFVQSLPYALDSVSAGFDDYPRFPLETLYDNGGDCEDTSILFAAIVKALGYGVIMLGFDKDTDHEAHVMAGVKSTSLPGQYYTYGGERYYMAETTGEGYDIGDVPTGFKGDSAFFIPLVAKVKFDGLTWTNDGYSGGLYHYTATIHNGGSLNAENLHVIMGYEASETTAWSQVEFNDGSDLGVDETITVEFSLKPPPRGHYTRTFLTAWSDNGPASRVQSTQWYTG